MPTFLRRAIVFTILAAVSVAVAAQGRRTEELMRKSGLWDQVAQMRAQMKAGIAEARDKAKASGKPLLGDEEFARLSAAIERTFAADVLRESVSLHMEELVSPADEVEVLKWLSSDLGTRFTRLEVASGEVAEVMKAQAEAPKLLAGLPKARLEKYQRLAASLDAGNSATTLTINLTSAIVYGIALVTPGVDADVAVRGIRERLESQRQQMVKYYAQHSLETYAYVYRSATDAQVEAYVRFAETPAARRYHLGGIKAMDETISRAALALGQDLGVAMQQRRNQS